LQKYFISAKILRSGPIYNNMNKTRITHCKHGHAFTPENTYWKKNGKYTTRDCKICKDAYSKRRDELRRQSKPAAQRRHPKPNEIDMAWAAGLFEGEGTITMTRIKSTKTENLTCSVIIVGNTDIEIVQLFHKWWGGWLRKRKKVPGKKQAYEWALRGKQTCVFVADILPYIKTQRVIQKAKLLLEAEALRRHAPMRGQEALTTQARLWEYLIEFRRLNKRGDKTTDALQALDS